MNQDSTRTAPISRALELIVFHGGPAHGSSVELASGFEFIEMEIEGLTPSGAPVIRMGKYSRVRHIGLDLDGVPFEWDGFLAQHESEISFD